MAKDALTTPAPSGVDLSTMTLWVAAQLVSNLPTMAIARSAAIDDAVEKAQLIYRLYHILQTGHDSTPTKSPGARTLD